MKTVKPYAPEVYPPQGGAQVAFGEKVPTKFQYLGHRKDVYEQFHRLLNQLKETAK
jgi:hypothetical protein